jgi:4-hydroxybenzoate polyprenyltransferase
MAPPVVTITDATAARRHTQPAAMLHALRIIHPFPTLLNVAATGGLALVAASGAPDPSVLARMLLVMLCAQSAIGITNDYCDRSLDARTKPWKPIVAGYVQPSMAMAAALALIAATAALAVTLGAGGFALAMLGLACGFAYDVWLKRSIFSAVPYMVAIPTLPLWVWVAAGEWRGELLWLIPLGALIGLALHLANTLPDIEGDAAAGVSGMAHRLGARGSMFAGWAAFGLALAWSVALAPVVGYDLRVYVPAAALGAACLVGSIGLYAMRRDGFALQLGFGALGIGSAVLAVAWLAAI